MKAAEVKAEIDIKQNAKSELQSVLDNSYEDLSKLDETLKALSAADFEKKNVEKDKSPSPGVSRSETKVNH